MLVLCDRGHYLEPKHSTEGETTLKHHRLSTRRIAVAAACAMALSAGAAGMSVAEEVPASPTPSSAAPTTEEPAQSEATPGEQTETPESAAPQPESSQPASEAADPVPAESPSPKPEEPQGESLAEPGATVAAAADCISAPERAGSAQGNIRIGSYNVIGVKAPLKDLTRSVSSRSASAAVRVVKYNPDIIGFQEQANAESSNDLKASMECRGYRQAIAQESSNPANQGVSLFYNPRVWKPLAGTSGKGEIPLKPVASGKPESTDNGRRVPYVFQAFESDHDGARLFVANIHLIENDEEGRTRNRMRVIQLKDLIVNRIAAQNPNDRPVYIVGDFNDYGTSGSECPIDTSDKFALSNRLMQTFCFLTQTGYNYRGPNLNSAQTEYPPASRATSLAWRDSYAYWNGVTLPTWTGTRLAVANQMRPFSSIFDITGQGDPGTGWVRQYRHIDHVYVPTGKAVKEWRLVLELAGSGEYASGVLNGTSTGYAYNSSTGEPASSDLVPWGSRDSDHNMIWADIGY